MRVINQSVESGMWQNRVRELRMIPAAELRSNPRNFRRHPERQSKALRAVLDQVGIAGALIAYQHPERGLELIDGHLRRDQGGEWPVLILDVNEDEANAVLATFDPLGAMAEQDGRVLAELVASLSFEIPSELFSLSVMPDEFQVYDLDLETKHACPKCGYEWS